MDSKLSIRQIGLLPHQAIVSHLILATAFLGTAGLSSTGCGDFFSALVPPSLAASDCSPGMVSAIGDPDGCCPTARPYSRPDLEYCYSVAPTRCPGGLIPALNDPSQCCPSITPYYRGTGVCTSTPDGPTELPPVIQPPVTPPPPVTQPGTNCDATSSIKLAVVSVQSVQTGICAGPQKTKAVVRVTNLSSTTLNIAMRVCFSGGQSDLFFANIGAGALEDFEAEACGGGQSIRALAKAKIRSGDCSDAIAPDCP